MSDKTIEDIEEIYKLAMTNGSLSIALKAKELIGKEQGLFKAKPQVQSFSLSHLSDEDLRYLIREIEKQLPLDLSQHPNVNKENLTGKEPIL